MLKYLLPDKYNLHIWLAALILASGILFLDWRPEVVIFSYLFETIVIGLIHVVKMIFVLKYSQKKDEKPVLVGTTSGPTGILVFVANYFFFVAVQMFFVFNFLKFGNHGNAMSIGGLINNFIQLFSEADMKEAYLVIIISNVVFALQNFFLNDKYRQVSIGDIFMKPYIRVFIQQTVVIMGGFIYLTTGGSKGLALLLIFFKTIVDLTGMALHHRPELKEKLIAYVLKKRESGAGTDKEAEIRKAMEKLLE